MNTSVLQSVYVWNFGLSGIQESEHITDVFLWSFELSFITFFVLRISTGLNFVKEVQSSKLMVSFLPKMHWPKGKITIYWRGCFKPKIDRFHCRITNRLIVVTNRPIYSPFQHHLRQGQIVRRPWDPLHTESPRSGGGDFQHWPHLRYSEASQGVGLWGLATAPCVLPHCNGYGGLWRLLYFCWGELVWLIHSFWEFLIK